MKTETMTFERETCQRCGGTGRWSYCQAYGSVCFQCEGKKECLTPRGSAANEFCRDLRSRKAEEIQIGDRVRNPYGKGSLTIVNITTSTLSLRVTANNETVDAVVTRYTYHGQSGSITVQEGVSVRLALTQEQLDETMRQAMEYQETLKSDGTPR